MNHRALLFTLLLAASPAVAAPHLMVEGILRDNSGNPLDGAFDLTFSLYAAASGGDAVWSESHADADVTSGLFQARLGETTPLSATVFAGADGLWLGVTLAGQPELPRTPLETDPFAFRALTAATAGGLSCTGCIDAGHVAFPYAAAASAGGDASVALLAKDLDCTGCIEADYLAAGAVSAAAVTFDDTVAKLSATNVQAALEKLKTLVDAASTGGSGGHVNEGNGQVASSTADQWALSPFATVKTFVHLFLPGVKPKVLAYLYGNSTTSLATGNNLAVAYAFTPNQYSANVTGKAGEAVLQVGSPSVFTPGSHILIHQSVGTGGNGTAAGAWELNAVKSVEGSTVQLVKVLARDYVDGGPSSGQAQAVVAASYNNLEVLSGGVISPSKTLSNGAESGGIVYIRAQTVTVRNGGKIHANGVGYENNGAHCPGSSGSECNGNSLSTPSGGTPNCSGGGGSSNSYCAGGGGGNKTAGGNGTLGSSCTQSQQGKGGTAKGTADAATLHFGGGGGNATNWCSGSTGGGIIVIGASTITVEPGGTIQANGGNSGSWNVGSGAGGTIALFSDSITNNGLLEAAPGTIMSYNTQSTGYARPGVGGEGWIYQKPVIPGIVNESYPKWVQLWVDGVNVTPSIGDPNGRGSPHFSAVQKAWGETGLAGWSSGPLDLSNVANWTLGEHAVELRETGGAGGDLKSYVYVLYPFTASAPPANDKCLSPSVIDPNAAPVVLSGTTEDFMGKTLAKDDSNLAGCGGAGGPDVVYQFTLAARSLVSVALVAPFSAKLYLTNGSCANGTKVWCADKDFTTDPLEPGTYWLWVDSDAAAARGNFTLGVSTQAAPLPTADTCASATKLVIGANGVASLTGATNLYALDQYKGLCPSAQSGGPDVVYEFDAGTGQTLTVNVTNANFAPIVYVYTFACGAGGVPLTCSAGTQSGGVHSASVTLPGLAGGKYWLVVDGQGEKQWGTFNLSVQLQ